MGKAGTQCRVVVLELRELLEQGAARVIDGQISPGQRIAHSESVLAIQADQSGHICSALLPFILQECIQGFFLEQVFVYLKASVKILLI